MTTAPSATPSVAPPAAALGMLPPGELACLSCGSAVPQVAGSVLIELTVRGRQGDPPLPRREGTVTFGRCPACAARAALAEALADAHPRLAAEIGNVLGLRLAAALDALDVLGEPLPEPTTATEPELVALLRHLTAPGAASRWAARYVPVMAREAHPDECAPRPWSHLDEDRLAALREGYAAGMAERVARSAPPHLLAPPPLDDDDEPLVGGAQPVRDGCLMCGVAAVAVPATPVARAGGPANAARDMWRPARPALSGLGGHGPGHVTGFTCPQCTAAVAHVGAFGPSALGRALAVHLDPARADTVPPGSVQFDGVVAWAAEDPRPAPSAEPWSHLGDLAHLLPALALASGGAR